MWAVRVYFSMCSGMFCPDMRLNRTLRVGFALLLALMLPLQGYAAMPVCAASTAAAPTAQHHCAHGSTAIHHHDCGNSCCGAAIALTPVRWIAPLQTAPEISKAVLWSPPVGLLDRLDRPPRFVPT
jgi:hypothetical protein